MPTKNYVDLTIMLVSHNAFRRDVRRVERAATGRTLDDPVQRKRILTGWAIFKTQLHIHHEGEDRDLWPRMAKGFARRADRLAVLAELEAEHQQIDPLLTDVDAAFADRRSDGDKLAGAIDALATVLESHLQHEETDGLPYVQEAVTEREWKDFLRTQRQALGMKGAAEFFPWVLDEATPEDATRVSAMMPPPLKLVMNAIWKPMYHARGAW